MSATLYPVFLKLEGRSVLLVGGGAVAAAKLPALLDAGASVTVVAPRIDERLERPGVMLLKRAFRPDDVVGAWWVVAAATPEVNRLVASALSVRDRFVNAVDDPAVATAYTGGVLRRGGVTVAVSTEGHSPALAGLLREALEAVIPDDIARWVSLARNLRREWRAASVPMSRRRPLLLEALNRLYGAT